MAKKGNIATAVKVRFFDIIKSLSGISIVNDNFN